MAGPTGPYSDPQGDADAGTSVMQPVDQGPGTAKDVVQGEFGRWTLPPVEVLDQLEKGDAQHQKLCARGNQDPVAQAFCSGNMPQLTSIEELLELLGLSFASPTSPSAKDGNPAFTLVAHSPSLNARLASAINPRAIIFTPPDPLGRPREGAPIPNESYVALAFTRGEQFIELAAFDARTDKQLRFYLFKFEQDCNDRGCQPEDLYSPEVESGFRSYSLYEDVDLRNTAVDCTQCHQTGGDDGPKFLLMQQLQPPWTHFMSGFGVGGPMLLEDYRRAHGKDENYAGIPGAIIESSDPEALQGLLENNGFMDQPIEYPGSVIEAEVFASNNQQPYVNTPPGESETWEALLEYSLRESGNRPAYHDSQVADVSRLRDFANQYAAMMSGQGTIPDLAGVFLDEATHDMGIRPMPDASGREILEQACTRCHHDGVSSDLSRSRFNASNLDALSREQKNAAIERLARPATDPRSMPPIRSIELTVEERNRAIEFLSQ